MEEEQSYLLMMTKNLCIFVMFFSHAHYAQTPRHVHKMTLKRLFQPFDRMVFGFRGLEMVC